MSPVLSPARIVIMGGPGSGKSTLARALGERLGLPVHHLDAIYWQAGWTVRPADEFRDILRTLIATPRWVMDGSFSAEREARLAKADLIIFLDIGVALRLFRVLRRWLAERGTARADMAPGCPERMDLAFLQYTLEYGGDRKRRLLAQCAPFASKLRVLRKRADVAALLREMDPAAADQAHV